MMRRADQFPDVKLSMHPKNHLYRRVKHTSKRQPPRRLVGHQDSRRRVWTSRSAIGDRYSERRSPASFDVPVIAHALDNARKSVLRLAQHRVQSGPFLVDPVLNYVGVTVHAAPNPGALLDVVFVHGLTGDKFTTWSFNGTTSWLNWLAEDFTSINVYAAAYESAFFASALTGQGASLEDRATTLLDGVIARSSPGKKIVFITHSLGGLIVKKLLRVCADSANAKYQNLLTNVAGVVFIATPHQGAKLAKTLSAVLRAVTSKSVDELKSGAELTAELGSWFRNHVVKSKCPVHSYYETRKTNGVMIVDKDHSNPMIGGCDPVAVEADHITICKPTNREAQLYCSVRAILQDLLNSVPAEDTLAVSNGTGLVALVDVSVAPAEAKPLSDDLLTDFEFYTASAPGDRRTLEEKLIASNRSYEIPQAKLKKERFSMAIQRHIAQPSSLGRLVRLMAQLECRFNRHAREAIANDATNDTINDIVQQKVVDPIVNGPTTGDEPLTAAMAEGALYYLTGNCHIEWDNV